MKTGLDTSSRKLKIIAMDILGLEALKNLTVNGIFQYSGMHSVWVANYYHEVYLFFLCIKLQTAMEISKAIMTTVTIHVTANTVRSISEYSTE